jgi:hypothetical protein
MTEPGRLPALHGLATLQATGRLRASHVQAPLDLRHRTLT